ncbi:hypothetical protein IAE39_004960 [Pseudomonas sp. S37]|uniref:hypothetical protein n=1 Tax=Pseudomonas sp. S37 TaxID=2767449 RepID=UPI001911E34E|nr:hypothetical protein [Pseudomonas sp. S37]MBK4996786.1 hypothetical protein [Pseudomonas sp. S37]
MLSSHTTTTSVALLMAVLAVAGCDNKQSAAQKTNVTTIPMDLKSGDGVTAKVAEGPIVDNTLVSADSIKGIQNSEYVVKGTMKFDGWFLKADKITFEPGATLVFSRTALSNRRQFWVVAKELVVMDAGNPGVITWEKGDIPMAPQAPGEAPSGPDATSNGQLGGQGNAGNKGSVGIAGASAPQITLVVLNVPGSGVTVDLSGGIGGQGGQGMKGGRGGVGAGGDNASQTAVGCRHGAGSGGRGGQGGNGGEGGGGGIGGAGGTFLLVSESEMLPSLTQKFRVKVAAGTGGPGGPGGLRGDGGTGGSGGADARPFCQGSGSNGGVGAPGTAGAPGAPGGVGQEGDFTIGGATKEQLKNYIWPSI